MSIMGASLGVAMISRARSSDEEFEIRAEKPSKPAPRIDVPQADVERMNAAQAKRERKNAKRLREMGQ